MACQRARRRGCLDSYPSPTYLSFFVGALIVASFDLCCTPPLPQRSEGIFAYSQAVRFSINQGLRRTAILCEAGAIRQAPAEDEAAFRSALPAVLAFERVAATQSTELTSKLKSQANRFHGHYSLTAERHGNHRTGSRFFHAASWLQRNASFEADGFDLGVRRLHFYDHPAFASRSSSKSYCTSDSFEA